MGYQTVILFKTQYLYLARNHKKRAIAFFSLSSSAIAPFLNLRTSITMQSPKIIKNRKVSSLPSYETESCIRTQ